ncbi:MAG: serine/threonine protein kinase [Planctomycetaceae bacterium]|jgi:serine/threonine protein kinase|nr:serine/threonine protein kinase [Planctomycetaceae bacterium]
MSVDHPHQKGSTQIVPEEVSAKELSSFASATMPFIQPHERPAESGETLPIGMKLGHFIIDDYIGGGGMGKVYLATDTSLDRKVAVKTLPPQRSGNPSIAARFINEAKSAARLNHENIAQVYFAGDESGLPFIAFEYIEGTNIKQLTEEHEGLPLPLALNYIVQVALALAHAAEHGVIHRDVKPSNILVTPYGKIKLIDMGLARLLDPSEEQNDLTASGTTLGTFDYIAPEQARDPRKADSRSDIYSLGCTFFFMLAARPPFPEGTALQKLLQHQGDTPPDIRSFQPNVPAEIALLIQQMMAKDPAQRFQAPAVLIKALITAAKNLGLQTTGKGHFISPQPLSLRRKFLQQHLPWITSVALLLCGFILMTLFSELTLPLPKMPDTATGQPLPSTETIILRPAGESAIILDRPSDQAKRTGFAVALSPMPPSKYTAELGTQHAGYQLHPAFASPAVSSARSLVKAKQVAHRLSVLDIPRVLSAEQAASGNSVCVIDPSGETAGSFTTLAEALLNTGGNENTEFVLRWNGTQKTAEPIVFNNRRSRFSAASGYFPVIEFEANDVQHIRHHLSFITVNGGKGEFKGIGLTIRVRPSISAPYWSLFDVNSHIAGDTELIFTQCSLTVVNTASSDFSAFHDNAAFFHCRDLSEYGEPVIFREKIAEHSTGSVRISVSNSLLCGEAVVLQNTASQNVVLRMSDSLLAVAKPLVLPADNPNVKLQAEHLFVIQPFVKEEERGDREKEITGTASSNFVLSPASLDKPLPKYLPQDFVLPQDADSRFTVPALDWLP